MRSLFAVLVFALAVLPSAAQIYTGTLGPGDPSLIGGEYYQTLFELL